MNRRYWFMIPVLALVACSNVNTPVVQSSYVALYSDQGVEQSCITATVNMFEWMGLSLQEVSSEDIRMGCLEDFDLVCFPGGDMYQYSQSLSTEGISRVRSFISNGGGYIGICGGGYFTAEKVYWMGNQLPMESLQLFKGRSEGPVAEFEQVGYQAMVQINILDTSHPITQSVLNPSWIFYWVGPKFIPENPYEVDILGEYDSGNHPVILAFEYGSGRVFIIGTHPEFEEDSDRDGFPPDSTLNDMGSDWELMENAARWCTGQI